MIELHLKGLDEKQAALTQAERRLADGMPELENELADDMANLARRKARSDSKSGRAMGSIRAMGPAVSAGMDIDYYGFFDFGGKVGYKDRVVRRYIRGGRYLFPAMTEIGVIRQAEAFADKATEELR